MRGPVLKRVLAAAAFGAGLIAGLAGCSADKPKPAPLLAYEPALSARALWSAQAGEIGFALAPGVAGGRVHVASSDGVVRALSLADGRSAWELDLKTPLAAGVGSDGRWAAVVTRDNMLVVIEGGRESWRAALDSRVATAPLVAGERVFVAGVDRTVRAFDAATGQLLWVLKRPGDPLTLAHTGVLSAWQDTLLVGHGPRLLGVDPLKGQIRWESLLASPRGTNEVERLADLVGPTARDGSTVCMRAFQNALGCVDAGNGRVLWSVPTGGRLGVALDGAQLYATDGSDRVIARKRTRGEPVWTAEQLLNRGLSAPLLVGDALAVGDAEGWIHLLARDTGRTLLRVQTDGSALLTLVNGADGTLLAITAKGGVFAFRIGAVAAPPRS